MSDLVRNPENQFSCVAAHVKQAKIDDMINSKQMNGTLIQKLCCDNTWLMLTALYNNQKIFLKRER